MPTEIVWHGQTYEVPPIEELEEMAFDGVVDTPDGCRVEPDHPDSWLSILGVI